MKSVKKYSKKKPRVQQNVQPKVQPRIQARSNKKPVNKKVSKKVNKKVSNGTKKVKRNKNKKLTKKNLKSRVNVSEGGGRFRLRRLGNPFRRREKPAEPEVDNNTMTGTPEEVQEPPMPVHTIFFDVDGTLGDTGCGDQTKPIPDEMHTELLELLKVLKKKAVKLFILTRCNAGRNICRSNQREYYAPIVEKMDGVFTADVLDIPIEKPLPRENGGMTWAAIKTMVMEEYCKYIPEEQRASVVLIDDDYRNARVASEHGFRAFHNNRNNSRNVGAALKMTNNALKKILKEMAERSKFVFEMKYDTRYFFDSNEILPPDLKEERNRQLGEELTDGIDDLTGKLTQNIKDKIETTIKKKSKKVICDIKKGKEEGTLVTYEKKFDDNFDVGVTPSYTETDAEKVNLEFLKLLGSDIYSSDNRFNFSKTGLSPHEIIIHWSKTQKCLVVYFGLNNILDKKNKNGVGFTIGRVFSRTEEPSDLFNLSEEEIRQFKTRVVKMYDETKLQKEIEMLEEEMSAKKRNELLSSEEEIRYGKRLKQINTMLENIDYANRQQSKIIIKIKRRSTPEVYSGFGNENENEGAVVTEPSVTPVPNEEFGGFGPNGNNASTVPPVAPVVTRPNDAAFEGFGEEVV